MSAHQNAESAMRLIEATLGIIESHAKKGTLSRSILDAASGALLALASDIDGMKLMTPIQTVRLVEMLAAECDRVVHRLGIVHDLIEAAAEGEQEGVGNG